MPMGIVSEADFDKEVKKIPTQESPLPIGSGVIKTIDRGRTPDKGNTPEVVREIIGELGMEKVPAKQLAKEFNVSESSVSAYKNAATSTATYSNPNPFLKPKLDEHRERLINKAKSKLDFALESITPAKLDECDAPALSTIAKNMSAIVRDLEPPEVNNGNGANIQFIFMSPKMREESSYDVIEVGE